MCDIKDCKNAATVSTSLFSGRGELVDVELCPYHLNLLNKGAYIFYPGEELIEIK